jgi:hypothetical protein
MSFFNNSLLIVETTDFRFFWLLLFPQLLLEIIRIAVESIELIKLGPQ